MIRVGESLHCRLVPFEGRPDEVLRDTESGVLPVDDFFHAALVDIPHAEDARPGN